MEFLLVNHPLDCPICDQGGECDLQVGSLKELLLDYNLIAMTVDSYNMALSEPQVNGTRTCHSTRFQHGLKIHCSYHHNHHHHQCSWPCLTLRVISTFLSSVNYQI